MNRSKYEKFAKEAVDAYVSEEVPLTDTVVKIAKREQLNPEQIKRVVEMSNTGTFLELFGKTAGSDDRMVDFQVVNPDEAVSAVHTSIASDNEKTASYTDRLSEEAAYYETVLDQNRPVYMEKVANIDKVKANLADGMPLKAAIKKAYPDYTDEECEALEAELRSQGMGDSPKEARLQKRNAEEKIARFRKISTVLNDRMYAANEYADQIANKMASMFRGIYSSEKLAEFEKNALALHGPKAVYAIQAVRTRLGKEPLSGVPSETLVKEASEYYVVDSSSQGMSEVGEYLNQVQEFSKCAQGDDAVRANLRNLMGQLDYRWNKEIASERKASGETNPDTLSTGSIKRSY